MLEVMLAYDQFHKYPDGSSWEVDDGMLVISDKEGEQSGHYSIGQWIYVRKVSS